MGTLKRPHYHQTYFSDNEMKALCKITAQMNDSLSSVIRSLILDGLKLRAYHNSVKDTIAEEAIHIYINLGTK